MDIQEKIKELEDEINRLKSKLQMQDKPIEIIQQVKTDNFDKAGAWQIGDIVRFELLNGEQVEAQCQMTDDKSGTFCLTHCLEERHCMNSNGTDEGGWDASELREHLNTRVIKLFPDNVIEKMMPIYEEDLLTLPAMEDIFGEWDYDEWEPKEGATPNWPLMKYCQYRSKGSWWWCRSAYCADATGFCLVNTDGSAAGTDSRLSYGLAPALRLIHNLN